MIGVLKCVWKGGLQRGEQQKRNRLPPGGEKKWRGCDVGGGREQVVSAMAQGVLHTRGRNISETFSWCVKLDGCRLAGVRVNEERLELKTS